MFIILYNYTSILTIHIILIIIHLVSEKGKPSKRDVESKIAKLWKMAEESKRKDKDKKDMRVWISSEKSKKQWDKDFVMEQEEILEIPARVCQTRTGSQTRDRVSNLIMNLIKKDIKKTQIQVLTTLSLFISGVIHYV